MAIAAALISTAASGCKSSSCGCDSFGEVITTQETETKNA